MLDPIGDVDDNDVAGLDGQLSTAYGADIIPSQLSVYDYLFFHSYLKEISKQETLMSWNPANS